MALVPISAAGQLAIPAVEDIGYQLGQYLGNKALRYAGNELATRIRGALTKSAGRAYDRVKNQVKFANRASDYSGSGTKSTELTTPTKPPTEAVQKLSANKRPRVGSRYISRVRRYRHSYVGPFTTRWPRSSRKGIRIGTRRRGTRSRM